MKNKKILTTVIISIILFLLPVAIWGTYNIYTVKVKTDEETRLELKEESEKNKKEVQKLLEEQAKNIKENGINVNNDYNDPILEEKMKKADEEERVRGEKSDNIIKKYNKAKFDEIQKIRNDIDKYGIAYAHLAFEIYESSEISREDKIILDENYFFSHRNWFEIIEDEKLKEKWNVNDLEKKTKEILEKTEFNKYSQYGNSN